MPEELGSLEDLLPAVVLLQVKLLYVASQAGLYPQCFVCGTGKSTTPSARAVLHTAVALTCVSVISASKAAFCAATCWVSFSMARLSCCSLPSSWRLVVSSSSM